MRKELNIVSLSGGKDSQATGLMALHGGAQNLHFVFADTGHEHPQTYEHIEYLKTVFGPIDTVKADFTKRIEGKRKFILENWADHGISQDHISQAADLLKPTGIPFLDLCLWKGRFPSTRARFCSTELKHAPLDDYMQKRQNQDEYTACISWQGVRRDESRNRAHLTPWEAEFGDVLERTGLLIHRPIVYWTAREVLDFSERFGVKHNPLYKQGMGRVGCMPCIHSRKAELAEIARRFPEELDRVKGWEMLASATSKRGCSTFYDGRIAQRVTGIEEIKPHTHGIDAAVKWARTKRNGDFDPETIEEPASCNSIYGLCE